MWVMKPSFTNNAFRPFAGCTRTTGWTTGATPAAAKSRLPEISASSMALPPLNRVQVTSGSGRPPSRASRSISFRSLITISGR